METLPESPDRTGLDSRPLPNYEREDEMRGMREARSRRFWLAVLPVVLLTALAAGRADGSASGNVKLFMLPKFTGIPPFTQADNGANQIGKGYGYKLDYGGPTTSSATQQVQFVDNAV